MKKFLIAVLLIIPIVVIFTLTLTGVIISNTINVNAEQMIIHDINDSIFDTKRTYTLPLEGGKLQIIIFILPAISFDSEVAYEYTEDSEGEVDLIKQEGHKYVIVPKKSGEVGLIIYPRSNYNLKQVINIYITSNYVTDFNIAVDENPIQGTLFINNSVKLYASFYPAEAIGANIITWQSSNPSAVAVDKNGLAKVKGKGSAIISASVTDMADVKRTAQIEVSTEQAITKQKTVYLSNQFNNEDWVLDNLVLHNGGDIEIATVASSSEFTTYKVFQGDREEEINVFNIPDGEWDILNRENFSTIYIDNGGYFLEAAYLDFAAARSLSPVFTSGNENVLKVMASGMLMPIKQGIAVVRATVANGEYKEIEIKVSHRANTFALNLTEVDNKVGIKLERVWGYNFISGSLDPQDYTHSHTLFFHSESATFRGIVIDDFKLYWEADNSDYATVGQDGLVTFTEQACGKDVKIQASELVHGVKTKLSKSYTFRVLEDKKAVNVFKEDLSLNVGGHRNIINYLSDNQELPIALHTDIDIVLQVIGGGRYARLRNSFYGNGYTVSAEAWGSRYDVKNGYAPIPGMENGVWRYSTSFLIDNRLINSDIEQLVIENTSFKGSPIPSEGTIQLEDFDSRGRGIDVYFEDAQPAPPIKLRYNHLRYYGDCIHLLVGLNSEISYDLAIEGSIIGDCSNYPVYIEERGPIPNSSLLIKNVVFKPSIGPSIIFMPLAIGSGITYQDIPDKTIINLTFEGFIDNYNWKRISQLDTLFMGLIDPAFLQDFPMINDLFKNYLKKSMEDLLAKSKYQSLKYTDEEGKEWVSLMGLIAGLWSDAAVETVSIKVPSYEMLILPMPSKEEAPMLKAALDIFSVFFTAPDKPNSDIKVSLPLDKPCYVLSYKFKRNKPDILPGQPCPSDEHLLKRLQGEG